MFAVGAGGALVSVAELDSATIGGPGLAGARSLALAEGGAHLYGAAANDLALGASGAGPTCTPSGFGNLVDDVDLSVAGP